LKTKTAIKTLQEKKHTKHGLTLDIGVEKLKQEQNQALKDHVIYNGTLLSKIEPLVST
jgi:hypothetical protein